MAGFLDQFNPWSSPLGATGTMPTAAALLARAAQGDPQTGVPQGLPLQPAPGDPQPFPPQNAPAPDTLTAGHTDPTFMDFLHRPLDSFKDWAENRRAAPGPAINPTPGQIPAPPVPALSQAATAPTPAAGQGPAGSPATAPTSPAAGQGPAGSPATTPTSPDAAMAVPQSLTDAERARIQSTIGGAPATPPGPAAAPGTAPSMPPDQSVSAPAVPPGSAPVYTKDQVFHAFHGQESGYGANPATSVDGAMGDMQITPATFKQYAKPGEDINNRADNLAVGRRISDDLYDKANGDPARAAVGYFSGPGNIAPPGSPTPWIKDFKDGTGKSVSSYVADIQKRLGMPASSDVGADKPGQASPGAAAQAGPGGVPVAPVNGAQSPYEQRLQKLLDFDPNSLRASPAEQLQAIASGLLSGPTFAQGLGKGIGNLAQLSASDRGNALKAQQTMAQIAMDGVKSEKAYAPHPIGTPILGSDGKTMVQRMATYTGGTYDVPVNGMTTQQQQANNGTARVGIAQQNADSGSARVGIAQQNADRQQAMFGYKAGEGSPYVQHSLTQAMKDGDAYSATAVDAGNTRQDIANIRSVIAAEPNVMGRDVQDRIGKFLTANLGIPVNGITPSGLDLASKNVNDLRTQMIASRMGGKIGRQAMGEFNQIAEGALNMGTNKDAAMALMDKVDHLAQLKQGAAGQWESMDPEVRKQTAIKYGGFNGFLDNYWQNALGQKDASGAPVAAVQPTVVKDASTDGKWASKTSTGVNFTLSN